MKKKVLLAVVVLLAGLVAYELFDKTWQRNEKAFKKSILQLDDSAEKVYLQDVTPFEWDWVYSFDPYTSKEAIYETVGYKWTRIDVTVSEDMNQLVFMKDGKVVCYVYGHPQNNQYGIYFGRDRERTTVYSVLHAEDRMPFIVDRSWGFVGLMGE